MAADTRQTLQSGAKKDVRSEARKAKADAQRKARGGRELTPNEKFTLSQVLQAANACKLIAEQIKEGKPVGIGVVQACATLAVAYSQGNGIG